MLSHAAVYHHGVRRAASVIATAALTAAVFGAIVPAARSSCAAPETVVGARKVSPGASVEIRGQYWASECNDVRVCSSGCGGWSCRGGGPSPPVTGITLVLRPVGGMPGKDWMLATSVNADNHFRFRTQVAVPAEVPVGRYEIVATSDVTGDVASGVIRINKG